VFGEGDSGNFLWWLPYYLVLLISVPPVVVFFAHLFLRLKVTDPTWVGQAKADSRRTRFYLHLTVTYIAWIFLLTLVVFKIFIAT
jgi:hypothetical protein